MEERIGFGMAGGKGDAIAGAEGAIAGAGLAIGVSTYGDSRLTTCPAAARTAGAVARALAPCLTGGVTLVTDPAQTYEVFMALQKAAASARGGCFFLYFAGITIRRGDELLLTTCGSRLDEKSACVPWADVDAILESERVKSAIIVLNAEGFAGVGWLGAKAPNVHGMGSVRIHDPNTADARIASYGDAVADVLSQNAHEIRAHLSDGLLDVAALGRALVARAPTPVGYDPLHPKRGEPPRHETFGSPEPSDVVLRDLREELKRPPPPKRAAPSKSTALVGPGADPGVLATRSAPWARIALIATAVASAVAALVWLLRR